MPRLSLPARLCAPVLLTALCALALSACLTPAPTPTATPTRAPRATFTSTVAVPPTATTPPMPTTAPSATSTLTPAGTATLAATATPVALATATPNPNVDPLTGLNVSDPALLQRRPLHVCIDNDTGARPHYGLTKADIVYEYLMERRVNTRFTAVYWSQEVDRIAPLRSVRLVNLELAPQYDALVACQGGSDGTLWNIKHDGRAAYYEFFEYDYIWMDMNFATGYYSIYGRHSNPLVNTALVESSTSLLRKWLAQNKQEKAAKVTGFTFSAPGSATPTAVAATTIGIPYPSECCAVQWTYDAAGQRYLRTMNGQPHTDAATNERISAANVVVVFATHDISPIDETPPLEAWGIRIRLTGEGRASIFRDGVAILGFWKRDHLTGFMQLVDAQGKVIPLHQGNSWIEIVPDVDFKVVFS